MRQQVIDVVIPAHEKDLDTLDYCIEGIRKNIADVRRIIVISKAKYTDKAEWFDESLFPFSFSEVGDLVKGIGIGWHFQQLLKLYSPIVIPNISENVLIVDSDTVFFRKVKFFSQDGLPLYNLSKDQNLDRSTFHQNALKHIGVVFPEIISKLPENFRNISGICHHMLFQRHLIEQLFAEVEKIDGSGDPFYKIFLKTSHTSYGIAEYNLYFYFLVSLHPSEYKIRILNYKNTADFSLWKYRLRRKYHYCSFHSYMRKTKENYCKKLLQKFREKVVRCFSFEIWKVGVIDFPIYEMLRLKPEVKWIESNSKINFIADPFGFEFDGKKYLVFEDYDQIGKRGRIGLARLNSDYSLSERKIILDDKKHLSYPFVIKHAERIFVICESYKSSKLKLYELDCATMTLKKVREIFANKQAIDPTVIFYQEKFWLFYTTKEDSNAKLHLSYANSLFDEFVDHPANPIKNDISSARSAGTPFLFDGKLFRPAQNCSETYGGAIVINHITELSETKFSEEPVQEIRPEYGAVSFRGMHTLSALGNQTLIDAKVNIFVPYKPLISLLRNLKRIIK